MRKEKALQIIPAIDLKDGHCVRLSQGRQDALTVYDNDPSAVARNFVTSGATMIHVVDLDGAFGHESSANRTALKTILKSVTVPIQFGGGVRTAEDIRCLTDSGVGCVVLGTVAAESPETLQSLVAQFDSQICVGIDAREGKVVTRGWETATEFSALDLARRVAGAGIKRIIYTDTIRDGMLTGPNIEQSIAVARASGVKVTVAGGMSSLEDIKRLRDTGEMLIDSVIVGKALYEGKFTLEEALRVADS
ncbi:MAG TPA: 1-(5-phosphoribosyl)-5-[(5-phosphoribosylamino)methylideneamino]imidazole-4-carboxamide isomerase [Pyrinomonadaceae bacterium]